MSRDSHAHHHHHDHSDRDHASRARRRFSAQQKIAILREHLLGKTPIYDVCDVCDRCGIWPTLFYRQQKQLFENADAADHSRARRPLGRWTPRWRR